MIEAECNEYNKEHKETIVCLSKQQPIPHWTWDKSGRIQRKCNAISYTIKRGICQIKRPTMGTLSIEVDVNARNWKSQYSWETAYNSKSLEWWIWRTMLDKLGRHRLRSEAVIAGRLLNATRGKFKIIFSCTSSYASQGSPNQGCYQVQINGGKPPHVAIWSINHHRQ